MRHQPPAWWPTTVTPETYATAAFRMLDLAFEHTREMPKPLAAIASLAHLVEDWRERGDHAD